MGLLYIDGSKNATTVQRTDYTFFGSLPGADYHFIRLQYQWKCHS